MRSDRRDLCLSDGRTPLGNPLRFAPLRRAALILGAVTALAACMGPPPSSLHGIASPPVTTAPPASIQPHADASRTRPSPSNRAYVEVAFERVESLGRQHEERFHGFAAIGPSGSAEITLRSDGGAITCKGRSRVTKRPPGPGARGLEGEAFIECSDGRLAIADYRYRTDTRGEGRGRDQYGARFTIRFMDVP